jgi:glycosyltransferase involved in cell wall biosynthesis
VVLFLGRVTQQKGPSLFIRVARRVADYLPAARFVVAGDGDQLPDTMLQAAELGIADRVFYTGGLSGPEVDWALRMADVCVMPSLSEPFGLVALESLRNGTPCIVPRNSGVAEVLANAIKVDFWDVEEMANQVIAIGLYPDLKDELRAQGLTELAQPRFTLAEPARQTLAIYQRALAAAGGHN